jgi:hypothetical protein
MNTYNSQFKKTPWVKVGKEKQDWEIDAIDYVIYSGGGAGNTTDARPGQQQEHTDEQHYADKSVMDKMSARRGPGDSTKADSGGGDADKRVVSRDVDSGPVNNDRGA